MSADADDLPDDLGDLLPDDLAQPVAGKKTPTKKKPGAKPLVRTPAQARAAEEARKAQEEAQALVAATTARQSAAARLAQIVNLHIAGYSYAQIGLAIGASESEVERMLNEDVNRYIRTQPALRVYVRNYISEKFTTMLDADWDAASDKAHPHKLENQDRAIRILDRLAKLHGADAPVQSEVKVESTPEAVEAVVSALAAAGGMGYDVDVFSRVSDTVPGTVVHQAAQQSARALEVSGNAVEESDGNDGL